MFIWEILLSSLLAAVLSMVLILVLGRTGPGPLMGFLFFFITIFLATWGGGLWLGRIRPGEWMVNWMGYVLVAMLLWLVLAAVLPRQTRTARRADETAVPVVQPKAAQPLALGILFWLMVLFLLGIIAVNYYFF
ncbi:MAG: hypothetical protein ABFD92_06690 [Planctomycetaceae bacterium]|nr:hypothetical protein [Planctomycetaceae bacterium]